MALWREFRLSLKQSKDPILDTIVFYQKAPLVSIQADPYDSSTWPDPWELLAENLYCEFTKVLGICYSLQLSECFNGKQFEIHIVQDTKNSEIKYLLSIDSTVYIINGDTYVAYGKIPNNLTSQHKHTMSLLH